MVSPMTHKIDSELDFKVCYPELDKILTDCKGDNEKAEPLVLDLYLDLLFKHSPLNVDTRHAARDKVMTLAEAHARDTDVSRLAVLTDIVMKLCDEKRKQG